MIATWAKHGNYFGTIFVYTSKFVASSLVTLVTCHANSRISHFAKIKRKVVYDHKKNSYLTKMIRHQVIKYSQIGKNL